MAHLHLFEAFGIELEYMIVDQETLSVRPLANKVFERALGYPGDEMERGEISWSNELALHVLELKTTGTWSDLSTLAALFHREISYINSLLAKDGATLLSTGAHPWMNPLSEAVLWPYANNEIYEAYHRIFDCRGHGWVNLQSAHLNLPFANDAEFRQLHSAIRVLLPLLPALSASTPFLEEKQTDYLDARLSFYGGNQRRVPEISGNIIPEVVHSQAEYLEKVLKPMFQGISGHDPEGLLQHEWLNSRAAIARFDRMAIEIRILDTQEAPMMDIAIIALVVEVLKQLVSETNASLAMQESFHETVLKEFYHQVVQQGGHASISDPAYLKLFGLTTSSASVNEIWAHLFKKCQDKIAWAIPALEVIFQRGTVSERLLRSYHPEPEANNLRAIYQKIEQCLRHNKPYVD